MHIGEPRVIVAVDSEDIPVDKFTDVARRRGYTVYVLSRAGWDSVMKDLDVTGWGFLVVLQAWRRDPSGPKPRETQTRRLLQHFKEEGLPTHVLTIDSSDVVDLQQGLERFAALLHGRTSTSRPISGTRNIVLAWDPEVLTSIDYANLIAAIADLARVEGAAGIHRVICETISVSADVGALI